MGWQRRVDCVLSIPEIGLSGTLATSKNGLSDMEIDVAKETLKEIEKSKLSEIKYCL